jgi:hypothetical protein
MEWLIIYSTIADENAPRLTTTVNAKTYTEALLQFTIHFKNAIAIELIKKEI